MESQEICVKNLFATFTEKHNLKLYKIIKILISVYETSDRDF